MTIVQLEYLLAVANCGSFSAAAQVCFVTQPSLSMQIKNLEEELGVVLLDRSKKPVVPTVAGKIVIENAREAIKSFEYVKESVNEIKGEVAGTLRIGVIPTVAPYLLHRFVPKFQADYPKVDIEILETVTDEIADYLKRDRLDAAVVSASTCGGLVVEEELFDDPFYAYVSPDSHLFERSNIRIEDISSKELIILIEGHCMRHQVLEMFGDGRGQAYSHIIEGGSIASLIEMANCTNCVTIIPKMAIGKLPDECRPQVKTLSKGAFSRKIVLAARRTYVKQSLLEALRRSIAEAMN